MCHGAVDLGLGAAPFVIHEVCVLELRFTALVFDFRTHAGIRAASRCFAAVLQKLVAIDAHDFLFREKLFAFAFVAERAAKRATRNFPEFGDLDSRGVHFEGRTHR